MPSSLCSTGFPTPTPDQEVEGTKKFFRELNRLGLTGVVDPGGNNMTPESYQALFKVWRQGQLTVRVAYSLCGITPGKEFEELKDLTQLLPMGFGDGMLRFNGIGERITWAMNNNNQPTEAEREKYYEIVRWAAERGMSVTMHWPRNDSVGSAAGYFRAREQGRAHRQSAMVHRAFERRVGGEFAAHEGAGCRLDRRSPDAARAARGDGQGDSAWWWARAPMLIAWPPTIRSPRSNDFWGGQRSALPGPKSRHRAEALRLYTMGSAWFSHDEDERGSLEPGKLADLAVLSKDYMTVPVEQVGGIESLLTMVGGKIVYAAGPYAQFEDKHYAPGSSQFSSVLLVAAVLRPARASAERAGATGQTLRPADFDRRLPLRLRRARSCHESAGAWEKRRDGESADPVVPYHHLPESLHHRHRPLSRPSRHCRQLVLGSGSGTPNSNPAIQRPPPEGSWWGGTPLWVLAEQQGMRAASFFWPGSDAEIQHTRPRITTNTTGKFRTSGGSSRWWNG